MDLGLTPSLYEHLKAIEGERHPSNSPQRLRAAQDYIIERLRSWDLEVCFDRFSHLGNQHMNIIAKPKLCAQADRFIIAAHIDTVAGTPGADDNASGVAALLEVSRAAAPKQWAAPIEFIFFTLEECGMVGSSHYAHSLKREGARIKGMLSLEMIGFTECEGFQHYPVWLANRFPRIGNYIGLAANQRSRRLLEVVDTAMRGIAGLPAETMVLPANGWLFPEARLSDHSPFWDCGFEALMVTDTAFFRNPHYHSATDTVDTLDLEFLARVTRGLTASLEALAGR